MKINRSLITLTVLMASSLCARQADYQRGNFNTPTQSQTSDVSRPFTYESSKRRVPLDYHNNEYDKRMKDEHFTYDPEEAGRTRR